jgi:inosine-uridine nucleoside N-ribohydrolase
MVPLEVTHRALATEQIITRLRSTNRIVANFAADLLLFFAERYRTVFGFTAPPVHDPCAVARVIDPEIVTTSFMHVDIEVNGELTAGRTVCDIYHILGKPANIQVGQDLNVARFWDMVIDTLTSYP